MMRVGDKVCLKNCSQEPVTRHGKPTDPGGDIEVRAYVIKETRTSVNVLWQDGTSGTYDAKELIPYLNPDEYDCWCVLNIMCFHNIHVTLLFAGPVNMSYGKQRMRRDLPLFNALMQ
jgi:hypothetical protein